MGPNPLTFKHGTTTGYGSYKCRCDPCKAAQAAYRVKWFNEVRDPAKTPHGTLNGYTNYKCRCDECTMNWHAHQTVAKKANRARDPERTRARDRRDNLSRYGLSVEQWEQLLASQGGRCACCDDLFPADARSVHVDHDHDTGKVRALLCMPCNISAGMLKDDPDRAMRLAVYLLASTDVIGADHA